MHYAYSLPPKSDQKNKKNMKMFVIRKNRFPKDKRFLTKKRNKNINYKRKINFNCFRTANQYLTRTTRREGGG